jgi:hypothetical protein
MSALPVPASEPSAVRRILALIVLATDLQAAKVICAGKRSLVVTNRGFYNSSLVLRAILRGEHIERCSPLSLRDRRS